ncbi:MAG: tyrosine-protein phosphatase [Pseudomonadales bacterium]
MTSRTITLPGAVNLRDFGGYAAEDGSLVRRGTLFRSGTLAHLSDEARARFADLGVGLICDLRRPEERDQEPTPFPPSAPRRLEIPIDPGSAIAMRAELAEAGVDLKRRIDFMVRINQELAREHADDYARMFEGLLELEDGGFLVHCSAGKDRTGFACALILHALGVSEQTVLEDYLITNEVMDYEGYVLPRLAARYEAAGIPDREAVMAIAGVRPEYLGGAYQAIRDEFEGVEHYIERAVGLDAAARRLLQGRYLDRSG